MELWTSDATKQETEAYQIPPDVQKGAAILQCWLAVAAPSFVASQGRFPPGNPSWVCAAFYS